jgi:type I restriction enzyme S subunit
MKEDWEIKRLGDVCEKITDGSHNPPKGVDSSDFMMLSSKNIFDDLIHYEDPRYLTQKDFETENKRTEVRYNDVLLTIVGTIGRVAVVPVSHPKFTLQRSVAVLKIKKGCLDSRFLMFSLQNILKFLTDEARGVAQKGIYLNQLREIEIPLPPLPEQQRIVAILDRCFTSIDRAKAIAEQNLKNAKELFESYLNGVFEKLFGERETRRISELAKVIGGYSFKSGDFKKEGKYQVIRMGNVRPGIIRENESPVFIDELEEKALSKALLIPKDVIITQTGTKNKRDYGFTVIIEKENYLLNQRIAAIRFKKEYLPEFFLYFSWTNVFKDQYFANETGTVGQGNVGIGAITDSQVPFISLNEQQTIVRQLDALRAETHKLEAVYQKKIADLDDLKKSILQKAFNGELNTDVEFDNKQVLSQ